MSQVTHMSQVTLAPTVAESAERRLREADFRFSRCIFCQYHEGVLLLRGRVPTYYLKQIAQTVVADVPGVEQVDNRIEVFAAIR